MQTTTKHGITFAVDSVTPAAKPLPECKSYQAVKSLLDSEIESCNDYHSNVVEYVRYHALLAAVYTAFSEHRPLVLSPDMIWLTILQGVAQHMTLHAERLRPNFVAHQGRETLTVRIDHFIKGSPENPWPEAFAGWSDQIRNHIGPELHDNLLCNFTTTGPIEHAAAQIVLMDIFERYFHYEAVCICGIPQITLEGTPDDWQRLRDNLESLSPFDLDWWLEHLRPICDHFAAAARGQIDLPHWQNICKLQEAYGGNIINGWIAKLFPYLREFFDGPTRKKNPIFETGEGFQSTDAPSGLSTVPFEWKLQRPDEPARSFDMEAIAGFTGIEQNHATLALRPKIGWAVRDGTGITAWVMQLRRHHTMHPPKLPPSPNSRVEIKTIEPPGHLPRELSAFYHFSNGADFFPSPAGPRFRILPIERLNPVTERFLKLPLTCEQWLRFCDLPDGSSLAIDTGQRWTIPFPQREAYFELRKKLDPVRQAEMDRINREVHRWAKAHPRTPAQHDVNKRRQHLIGESIYLTQIDQQLFPFRQQMKNANFIILCHPQQIALNHCRIVAESIAEFFDNALRDSGTYWWENPNFPDYGDAMEPIAEVW